MPFHHTQMPKKSDKQVLLSELGSTIKQLILDNRDNSEDFKEIVELTETLERTRNLKTRTHIPKTTALFDILWDLPDDQFKLIARMSRESFVELVKEIENKWVFYSYGTKMQAPVWKQLLLVLNRLGTEGNGAAIMRYSIFHGVSYGTVEKYTWRVLRALLDLQYKYVTWPNAIERVQIRDRFKQRWGLPGAVGIIDGTPVHLYQRPGVDGEVYFTRKGRYSINLQLVCDDRGIIRYYVVGWPGSCYDSTVLDQSAMGLNPERYFALAEWMLADSGYTLKWWICTPYKKPATLTLLASEVLRHLMG